MKCIQKGEAMLRVMDLEADIAVRDHGWKFISKSVWKLSLRRQQEGTK